MKVSAKGNSRFLSQEDVPEEGFTAIIKDVRVEALKSNRGDEDKYVLYFTAGKPMVFNVVNRQTVIASYGDDSDNWLGKPVEIYVDPNVYMGGERTGGIRVRIPRPAAPAPKPPPPVKPAANGTPQAPRKVYTIEEKQAGVLRGYRNAQTEADVHTVAAWADKHDFAQHHQEEQADAYNAALDRLGVGLAVHVEIPF